MDNVPRNGRSTQTVGNDDVTRINAEHCRQTLEIDTFNS